MTLNRGVLLLFALGTALALSYSFVPALFSVSYEGEHAASPSVSSSTPHNLPPTTFHLERPEPMKAIYMSQCVVGTPSFREELVQLVDTTELNSIVIDIRDYTGKIAFPTNHPLLVDFVSDQCGAKDMKSFIAKLHEKNIFVIGRVTVFQNPAYTKAFPDQAVQRVNGGVWTDRKGLAFVDVGAKPYWESVVALAKESYDIGFDEINFDYIRYPSDGDMEATDYTWSEGKTKSTKLEEFFSYLHENLEGTGIITSADLFGYVTVMNDDLGIGQVLERALPYFDYIYPMTYPSHYNKGFAGIPDPNKDVYKVIYESMSVGIDRALASTTTHKSFAYQPIASTTPQKYSKPVYSGKVVPWLQDFDYPVEYTPQMVQDQIQAAQDSGTHSYLFWDAGNKYSSLRQLLAPAN